MRDIQGAEGATQSLNYVNDPIAISPPLRFVGEQSDAGRAVRGERPAPGGGRAA